MMGLRWWVIVFIGGFAAIACRQRDDEVGGQVASARAVGEPLQIAVTADGFVPAKARVKVGRPVTLTVTRKVERTCATEIVIKEYGVNQPLPLNQPVQLTITPKRAGPIRYACAMDMIAGELLAE